VATDLPHRRLGGHAIEERAQRAGCSAIVLTVDNHWPRYNETLVRAMRQDPRVCTDCHVNNSHDFVRKAPLYHGVDVSRVKESTQPSALTWDYLDRVRGLVRGKLLVKGIMRGDEAADCVRHGADGVIVSNHAGRRGIVALHHRVPAGALAACRGFAYRCWSMVASGAPMYLRRWHQRKCGHRPPADWGSLLRAGRRRGDTDIYARELRAIMRQAGTPSVARSRATS
jgi:hypothetical protein